MLRKRSVTGVHTFMCARTLIRRLAAWQPTWVTMRLPPAEIPERSKGASGT